VVIHPFLKYGGLMSMIKLKKGDKIIERTKDDYDKNINTWTHRGYSPVEEKGLLDKIKKKAPKKKKSK
jgi:hypothetical protein